MNDIQTRLKAEFGISMTYMEARLLAVELEVRLRDKTVKAAPVPAPEAAMKPEEAPGRSPGEVVEAEFDGEPAEAFDMEEEPAEAEAEGSVAFEMAADELIVPGALVSGTARFSDGTQAKWYLDQMGRLSLKAAQPGYQPPKADVPKFQQGLEKILIKMGLY